FLGAPSGLAILTTRPFSARSPFSSSTTKTRSPPCTIRLPTYGGHSAISHGLAATWDGTDTAAATVNKTTSPALAHTLSLSESRAARRAAGLTAEGHPRLRDCGFKGAEVSAACGSESSIGIVIVCSLHPDPTMPFPEEDKAYALHPPVELKDRTRRQQARRWFAERQARC